MKILKQEVRYYEEEIPKNLEEFKNWEFSSISITEKDFKVFARLFKKFVENAIPSDTQLVNYSRGHYDLSGFIKKNRKYVYFSISDVRHFTKSWFEDILIRTAENDTDYTGGSNNYTTLEKFGNSIEQLLKS